MLDGNMNTNVNKLSLSMVVFTIPIYFYVFFDSKASIDFQSYTNLKELE